MSKVLAFPIVSTNCTNMVVTSKSPVSASAQSKGVFPKRLSCFGKTVKSIWKPQQHAAEVDRSVVTLLPEKALQGLEAHREVFVQGCDGHIATGAEEWKVNVAPGCGKSKTLVRA